MTQRPKSHEKPSLKSRKLGKFPAVSWFCVCQYEYSCSVINEGHSEILIDKLNHTIILSKSQQEILQYTLSKNEIIVEFESKHPLFLLHTRLPHINYCIRACSSQVVTNLVTLIATVSWLLFPERRKFTVSSLKLWIKYRSKMWMLL